MSPATGSKHAICLTADNATIAPLLALQAAAAAFEPEASMAAQAYAPHITLAIYERIELPALQDAFAAMAEGAAPLRLRFARIRHFGDGSPVVWAAPGADADLAALHEAVHRSIDPARCHPHYRPGAWIPHCTLATGIAAHRMREAQAALEASLQPFDVLFDTADCLTFPPVQIIERRCLATAGAGR
ncbi:2'-5' RNA ligase family protein [Phreatobacter sp. AB_2022a]|uniref:2'-5' RNA ligase family protein n=1 Tax=Phreatobacter sp. AB_2022a TaxID=3003134 RepID=UPI002286FF15|nr:2'-5' RNA ligase family protein [Phreatobacter sp. AB_2022a]MCZ0733408.1 2'-5' RNA ligase family protein [Phreatobacter sp. AB_2022a]